jgi:hypothetical protein
VAVGTRRSHSIPVALHAQIRGREHRGASLRTLASVYGVSHETIRRVLRVSEPSTPRTPRLRLLHATRSPRGGAA